jgi:methionine-rich copper-binding protein CopC
MLQSLPGPLTRQALQRTFVALLLAGGASFAWMPAAQAHAVLVSMTPADGSLVMTPPSKVVLTFDEAIQTMGDAISVLDPSGKQVQSGAVQVVGSTMTELLEPITMPGHYVVSYRVVSDDGHAETAELGFDYLTTSPTQAPAPVASTDSSWLTTALVTLGIVVIAAAGFIFMRRRSAGSGESTD